MKSVQSPLYCHRPSKTWQWLNELAKRSGSVANWNCGGHRVARRVDHRDGVAACIGDIDVAAVGGDCYANRSRSDADGYRRADHGVGRRVDHRDGAAEAIGDIDVAAV